MVAVIEWGSVAEDTLGADIGDIGARRSSVAAAILVAIAVVLLYGAMATSDQPTVAVAWGSLALAAYAAGLLCLVNARYGHRIGLMAWKFGPWTLLWFGIGFGLASISWTAPQTGTSAEIVLPNVLRALWLVGVGITAWTVGYFSGLGRPVHKLAARAVNVVGRNFLPEVRSPLTPWTLYAVGLTARVAETVLTGRFGYVGDASSAVNTATSYDQVVGLLTLCSPLAVCVAALQVYREGLGGARFTLVILFVSELGFGAASGGKAGFVITVLAVIVPMCAARRRLPKAITLISCVAFVLVVIPFNHAYRGAARNASGTLSPMEAIGEAPGILRQTLINQNPVTAVPGSMLYLLQRIREIDGPAVILQRTGTQIPFLSPVQLFEAPLIDTVPRAIWPGKPILVAGYKFSQEYYDLPSTVYTSSSITPVGDLYRYGGWIPVMFGMFLLGGLAGLLDDTLDVRSNPHATFLVLLLFPALVKSEDDWATMLAGLPAAVVVWLLCVSISFRRRRSA